MLERAIPDHLLRERTCPAKTPADFQPAYPSYVARFPPAAKDLVMAVIGAQFPAGAAAADVEAAVERLTDFMTSGGGCGRAGLGPEPAFAELAAVTDAHGYENVAVLAYWPDRAAYEAWEAGSGFGAWWAALDAAAQPHGWFREVFFPALDHFETIFSDAELVEGAAHMRVASSGPVREHVYWGSMRDRMPAAQTDALAAPAPAGPSMRRAPKGAAPKRVARRVRVPGRPNLCVIRSGQDWRTTRPAERELYLGEMHPVLQRGMNFLRDDGEAVGCYSCRFMDIVDAARPRAADQDRTFGLAYFDELASLEAWSREHPTHLAIFGGFLQYNKKLDNNISLRVFHEVFVLQPDQQLFEYVACHENTGMMIAANPEDKE